MAPSTETGAFRFIPRLLDGFARTSFGYNSSFSKKLDFMDSEKSAQQATLRWARSTAAHIRSGLLCCKYTGQDFQPSAVAGE